MNVPLETPASTLPVEPAPPEAEAPARPRRLLKGLLVLLLGATTAVALAAGFCLSRGGWYLPLETRQVAAPADPDQDSRTDKIEKRLAALGPKGIYVVVDTYENHLRVYKNGELLRDARCSTGSGTVLKDPRTGKVWIFDTPLGEHEVQRKVKDPIWSKPDWAFIEEGYQPPPAGSKERFDDFSLGAYGLYLGDGYIIHGTVFQTLLGRRVTHGCIRLGDDDLEYVYKTVPLGSKVYLF
ncbi:MAG TPA: L,D-transpeptidase family protein [Thermoanaerobaculia bacterium]|nr:L,D-transpeptidase family protein [Thermoanaerobaculia bacterium]